MSDILSTFLQIMGGLAIISGGIAAIVKAYNVLTTGHDNKQKYDEYDIRINELDKKVDALEIKLQNHCDKKIETMQTEINGKLQQIASELCMLSYCTLANLDGLKQQGCNGKVTEAREKLEKHLNQQAHGEI